MKKYTKKKIALVVQRCGKGILAGAEIYTYEFGQAIHQFLPEYDVDIYTSKSESYIRWNNHLSSEEIVNEHVKIIRFPVKHTRLFLLFRVIKRISIFTNRFFSPIYNLFSKILDSLFLRTQGPWCPELWTQIEQKQDEYDLVIVKCYLYAPNVYVINSLKNSKKVLFIVTGHNEPEFKFNFVKNTLKHAQTLGFVSLAERALCHKIWSCSKDKSSFILPPGLKSYTPEFLEKINHFVPRPEIKNILEKKFFICLGRIDKNKNTNFLFRNTPKNCVVVFAGDKHLKFPNDPRFIYVGRVTEEEKYLLLKKSIALLMVSRFEAYSIVTAEALSLQCFVMALKGCPPVDELIQRYGGISIEKKFFGEYMLKLQTGEVANIITQESSELIWKEKSWQSNVEKIKPLLA